MSEDNDDWSFFLRDLPAEKVRDNILKVLYEGKPSELFCRGLAWTLDPHAPKKPNYKMRITRAKRGTLKKGTRLSRREVVFNALSGADPGQVESLVQDLAAQFGVDPRTIYRDLEQRRQVEEIWRWLPDRN